MKTNTTLKKSMIMKHLFLCVSTVLFMVGCSQIEEPNRDKVTESEEGQTVEATQTRAGTTLENPYSLLKMQQAYNVIASQRGLPAKTLAPTDHYVKFYVADSVQYVTLSNTDLELFDYPMHLELTQAEEEAYANQDPANGMWFWTTVSPYFVYPSGITHEKLDDIYIQRVYGTATRANEAQMSDDVWDAVLDKSLEMSGYGSDTRAGSWYPSATVRYVTDHPNYPGREFPLEGVKIRVSHGVNYAVVYTNSVGNTGNIERNSGRLFKKPVDYKIKWDNKRWNIRSGRNGQAKTWGPKNSTSSWNITFGGNNLNAKYATAHKALYNYVYKNQSFALTRDLTISGINKLNTGVIDGVHRNGNEGKFNWINPIFAMNAVRLWVKDKDSNNYIANWKVEETMYHELGHASHYRALRIDGGQGHNIWIMANDSTGEPYPEFVASCFMRSIYPTHQYKYHSAPSGYNGLGEWLNYSGFTPKQIENIMCEENLNAWRTAAKNINVVDPVLVDALFDYRWNTWRTNMRDIITGPDKPALNTNVTYGVPMTLPDVVSFNGWTVTPSSYTTTTGLNTRTPTVKFTAGAVYTLTANFRLPNNTIYAATKVIDLSPTVVTVQAPWIWLGGFPSGEATLFLEPQSGAVYEWELNGSTYQPFGSSPRIYIPYNYLNSYNAVRCRAMINGVVSDWSNTVNFDRPYYAPAKKPGKTDDEFAADENDVSEKSSAAEY